MENACNKAKQGYPASHSDWRILGVVAPKTQICTPQIESTTLMQLRARLLSVLLESCQLCNYYSEIRNLRKMPDSRCRRQQYVAPFPVCILFQGVLFTVGLHFSKDPVHILRLHKLKHIPCNWTSRTNFASNEDVSTAAIKMQSKQFFNYKVLCELFRAGS